MKRLVIKVAVSALKDKNMFPASNLSLFSKAIFFKKIFGRLTALLLSSEYWQLLRSGLRCSLLSVPEHPAVGNKTLERIKMPNVHSVSHLGCQLRLLHRVRLLKQRHPSENVKRGAAQGCLRAPPSPFLAGVSFWLSQAESAGPVRAASSRASPIVRQERDFLSTIGVKQQRGLKLMVWCKEAAPHGALRILQPYKNVCCCCQFNFQKAFFLS